MSITANTVMVDVLDRIRDVNALAMSTATPPTTASGQTFTLLMISVAQNLVSLAENLVTASTTLALSANTTLYDIPANIADYGGRILGVFIAGTGEIDGPVNFKSLGHASRTWVTDTGTSLVSWSPIGMNLIAFVPAFASSPPTVTIRYDQSIATITSSATNMSIPDDEVEKAARLAELLCRIKMRQLTGFNDMLQDLANDMKMKYTADKPDGKML